MSMDTGLGSGSQVEPDIDLDSGSPVDADMVLDIDVDLDSGSPMDPEIGLDIDVDLDSAIGRRKYMFWLGLHCSRGLLLRLRAELIHGKMLMLIQRIISGQVLVILFIFGLVLLVHLVAPPIWALHRATNLLLRLRCTHFWLGLLQWLRCTGWLGRILEGPRDCSFKLSLVLFIIINMT